MNRIPIFKGLDLLPMTALVVQWGMLLLPLYILVSTLNWVLERTFGPPFPMLTGPQEKLVGWALGACWVAVFLLLFFGRRIGKSRRPENDIATRLETLRHDIEKRAKRDPGASGEAVLAELTQRARAIDADIEKSLRRGMKDARLGVDLLMGMTTGGVMVAVYQFVKVTQSPLWCTAAIEVAIVAGFSLLLTKFQRDTNRSCEAFLAARRAEHTDLALPAR